MTPHNQKNPLKRLKFFAGQLLSAEDFEAEQQYFLEKHKRHNRCLHGAGIVCGLEVSIEHNAVLITPGLALDCAGNEICVCEPVELDLPKEERLVYLAIRYLERETGPVPVPGPGDETIQNSRIEEGFELRYERENPFGGHGRGRLRCRCCGVPHSIPLGRLRGRRGRWSIDQRFRPPRVR